MCLGGRFSAFGLQGVETAVPSTTLALVAGGKRYGLTLRGKRDALEVAYYGIE